MNTKPEPGKSITDVPNDIQFIDIFNIEDIQRLQDLFSDASGVSSLIIHPDGTPITKPSNFCRLCDSIIRKTEKGLSNCLKSDAAFSSHYNTEPVVQQCLSLGLWNAGASITIGGKHVANWLIGQVRNDELDERWMIQYAAEIGADSEDFAEALKEVPVMSVEQFTKVSKMLYAFANQLSEKAFINYQLKMQINESKRAEEELEESREKYRGLCEAAFEAVFISEKGICIEQNQTAEKMFGYTSEEAVGRYGTEWIAPEDREMVLKNMLTGYEEPYEATALTKDGKTFACILRGKMMYYKGRNVRVTSVTDITDRKMAEEKLLLINKAVESASDAIGISDARGHHFYQNKALSDLFEYPTAEEMEANGGGTAVIVDPEIAKEMYGNIMSGKSWSGELEMITKNGRIFPAYERADAIKDSVGNIIGLIGIINDITERKRVEIIRQIQFNIARNVLLTDTLRQFLETVSEELSRLLDTTNFFVALYNEETDTLKQVIYKDQKDQFTEWKSNNSLSGQVVLLAKTLLLKKQEIIEFGAKMKLNLLGSPAECWLGVPLIIDQKAIGVMVVQSYTDPAAYDQASSDLLELIAHELSLYIERGKMIEDLVIAQKKAEESDRLKSAFLANMSHEIRTPMNGILGFAELLKEPGLSDEEQKTYLDIIEKSGTRMLSIINDIISISKVESGQMEVAVSETNINHQIEYICNFFKLEADQKGLRIFFKNRLPDTDAIMKTDIEKVYAILINLAKNAIKFTDQGFIEIGCEIKRGFVEFFVKDSGAGIREEHKEFIFERFRQGSESLGRNYEGAGLGLSISKAYAEMLGGRIWVESAEGKGSTFYFTVPTTSGRGVVNQP